MDSFGFAGPARQFFTLLDIKTKRAHEAEKELKEMQFDKMVTKGLPDPFDLKYLKPAHKTHPCLVYPLLPCEYGLEEPCTGCPIWKEVDGE